MVAAHVALVFRDSADVNSAIFDPRVNHSFFTVAKSAKYPARNNTLITTITRIALNGITMGVNAGVGLVTLLAIADAPALFA
jgi:hypothetical protein